SMQKRQKTLIAPAIDESATGIRYDDVYISPSHIKFSEAFEGVAHRQRIIIKNVGYKPALIRICPLNSIVFQVKTLKGGIRVSPGLSITTYVTYEFKRPSILRAIIPIEINGKIFNYHVISTLATEYINIEPKSIDFGTVDIGHSSCLKIITIRNEGNKSTRFSIDLGINDISLKIKPLRGRIKPQKEIILQIKLTGINEGIFYSEFWIKSTPNIRVPIKVHVIVPKLVIYHSNTTGDFTLIDFPPTVENTCIDPIKDISKDNPSAQKIYMQESMTEISVFPYPLSTDSGIYDVVKLCLYGEMETIKVHFEPDTLYFGDLIVGQISQRVLRLTNLSAIAPIYLESVPNAAVHCYPKWMKLMPKTSIEVLVKICGKESIESSFKLFFNVAADSYCDSTVLRRCFDRIKVGSYCIVCTVNIIFKSKKGLLSRKSLPIKKIDEDEEIMKRLLSLPKWKLLYKDYSQMCKFTENVKSSFKKSIFATKAAVLIPLSPLQIYKIHIYPTTLVFGLVASNSFNYQRLVITNTNDIPVMIQLIATSIKGIYFPEGDLMILQPGSTMTKLVEYFADEVYGKFNGYINYIINHNHSFELNITACIVRKQLHIDEKEIKLEKEWSREELYQPIASIIRITNKLNVEVRFRWEISAMSGFYIEPKSGSVRNNATLLSYVYYEFNNMKDNYYTQAIMICESGIRVSLRLSAPRFVPKVQFVNDIANLGEIPLHLPTKAIAILQNFEFNEVTYEVYLTFDVCCQFTIEIAITIQGCLQLLYRINGNVSFPRLRLVPQRIDIKRLRIGALQTHQITATNVGTTLLKLQVLLEEYPEFHVSLSANDKNSTIGTEGITIAPGTSQNLYLHFQPIDLASCAFYLPIVINELLGPVSMLNPKSIRPAEILKLHEAHYMYLSGFSMTTLPDKLPTLAEELFIENRVTEKTREILMSINIEEFNKVDCPFTIKWSRGVEIRRTTDAIECTLHPGDNVSFILEFKPRKRGNFSAEAPIYIRGELDDGVFNKLRLDGEFPASSIDVEPTEIYFMSVPLGMTVEKKFRIRAKHFDNTAFIRPNFLTTPRCSGDYKNELLRVDFPNGNVVSPQSYEELEAKVTFKSNQPVSFCSIIEFSDNNQLAVCLLTIYATADNNLLTTYMYPTNPKSNFKTYTRYLEPVSYPSISSDSPIDDGDCDVEEISNIRSNETFESKLGIMHFDNQSRSIIDKRRDSKLYWDKQINDSEIDIYNKNIQVNRKQMLNDKRILIHKKSSIAFGARNHRYPERLSSSSSKDRNDDCEKYMERITTIVEEWMYSGPLKFRFYPNISYGITAAFSYFRIKKRSYVRNSKRVQESHTIMLSFIDVLESIVGPDIHTYLGKLSKQLLPENNIERINYVLQLYNKILDFLLSQGAYLVHVSPQFLLNYDDYLISIDIVQSNVSYKAQRNNLNTSCVSYERLSRQLFESRSKQYWLDVTLQTYKCFVLRRIHEYKYWMSPRPSKRSTEYRESTVSSTSSLPKQSKLHERAIENIANLPSCKLAPDDRCSEEKFLLAWLRYHYEQQRVRDWMTDRRIIVNPQEKQDVAEYREIQNFHYDLSDSLVLIAVTAAYCPFLIDEYFSNLYICSRNKQEMLHNAICLVTAWRKIRLGFIITPMQLVNPNQVQILMLVVHLFQVLPSYVPRVKVKFNCSLSQIVTKQINVSNPTDNIVNYLLLLINDDNHFFTILKPESSLRLNAYGSGQIQIQFHAKKIQKNRAYLILCGRAIGSHFGRNQIIILEGHIDNLGIASKYIIRSKLYQIFETNLKIRVPYQNAAEYDIWMTDERPSNPATLKMTQWRELRARKIPRRLFLNQDLIVVAEGESEAHLSISVACILPKQQTFWLIFQAKTGDFIIQINSVWQKSINDCIVVQWTAQGECICSNQRSGVRDTCPFNISIPIPSCNEQFRRCVTEMFKKTLEPREYLFWSKYSDTYIELRLIKWLMRSDIDSAALEFVHVFNTTVTYKVTISDKSSPLILPERFTIQDVRPFNQQVPMIVHILPTTPPLYEATLTLTSLDDKEFRVYTIDCLRS
ncbi:CFA47 protein, partial [Acromyrmex charruanus]